MGISRYAFVFYGCYCEEMDEDSMDQMIPFDHPHFGYECVRDFDEDGKYFAIISSTKTYVPVGDYKELKTLNVPRDKEDMLMKILKNNGVKVDMKWILGTKVI